MVNYIFNSLQKSEAAINQLAVRQVKFQRAVFVYAIGAALYTVAVNQMLVEQRQ